MRKQNNFNVPNLLSASRILAVPFITYGIFTQNRSLFIILLSVNLITDVLDGWIARTFRLQTEFGARLDSLADLGTYIMAFAGMIVLEWDFVSEKAVEFLLLIGLYFAGVIVCLARFRRTPSLHLYSSKITGYLQGIFIFSLFVVGYSSVYFYLMLIVSYLAYLEELVIVSTMPELRSNVKGIYFMLKEREAIR